MASSLRWSLTFCLILSLEANAQNEIDSIRQRIFLIGDAGDLHAGKHPVIDWLSQHADMDDERNLVLYMGDNIYPYGLPFKGEATYSYSKEILDYQISLVKNKKGQAIFIPGNHDWKNGKIGGWQQINNQVDYINTLDMKNVAAWPQDGCPGPVEIKLNDSVVLVLLDSQWWLHLHEKPGIESHCEFKTEDQVITALEEIAESNKDNLMIVAMHHPMYSFGVHGGNYTLRHHLFPFTEIVPWLYIPLPILGSIYPVSRGIFGNIQDVRHPMYRTMINEIENVLEKHPNAIHVSGHDHSLQLLVKDSVSYIVSGTGTDISRVRVGKLTKFAELAYGFATLEIRKSGKVETKFYTLASKSMDDPVFTQEMKQIVKQEAIAPYVRIVNLPDSVTVAANPDMKGSFFKNLLFGKNYREEWTQPIRVRVLDISTDKGGLTPIKKGGGKQTKSLRLVDSTGKEYALRSIQKFPGPAIPAELRESVARDIVEQGISASYPYAAFSVVKMADEAGIPYLENELVYVADDTLLGRYREDFANTLCMLEEREPGFISKTDNTEEVALKIIADNDDHIAQKDVLKARILDMFIMDFDRHEDQWRWYTSDTGRGKIYHPIPKDRDQAFYTNQGIIPAYAKKRSLVPDIQGLRPQAYSIKSFNKSARNFDRAFLNELDKQTWEALADEFIGNMTDSVIEQSFRLQPPEIQKYNASKIVGILKERKKYLKKDLLEYYRFISKIVNVVGSDKKELFIINRNDDGTVHVVVNKIDKDNQISSRIYDRVFDPQVTRELRIYGLDSADRFEFNGAKNGGMKIRIIGGSGEDEFVSNDYSNRTIVYDASFEDNIFRGNDNYRKKISADPIVNQYNRLYYKYNVFNPSFSFAWNRDDGLFLGAGFTYTSHGFRKEPYANHHSLLVSHALATKSYNVKYEADFTDLLGKTDLLVRTNIKAPINVENFFGIGNETFYDKSKPGRFKYYRTRYDLGDLALMLRRNPQSWMTFSYGLAGQYYHLDSLNNQEKFINNFAENGMNAAQIQATKFYAGPVINLLLDNRNNKALPERGTRISATARHLWGLNDHSDNLTSIDIDLALFISIVESSRSVLATRFGYGRNFGNYEFFQAQYLGGKENLRGYHNNRFAGRTKFFNNTEIRFRLANFNTYLFPGSIGLVAFNDVGRVWADNENSSDWHVGNGIGLYISPLHRFVVTGYFTRSKEGNLPLVTFGFQF
jgi:hypothetical protein